NRTDTNEPSGHVKFHGNAHSGLALLGRKIIEPLEADDSPVLVFHQDHVVVGFLAETFLLGIVEPDTQGVSLAVVVDRQLFHSSLPGLKKESKDAHRDSQPMSQQSRLSGLSRPGNW